MYVCETYWNSLLSLCLWLWLWLWLFLIISFNVISCHITSCHGISYHVMSYSVLHQNGKTALIQAADGGHTETVTSLLDRGINQEDGNVSYCDACMIVLLYYGTVSCYDIWYQSISLSVDLHVCMRDLLEFSAFSLFLALTLTLSPHLIQCHIMSYSVLHQIGMTALISAACGGHKEIVMSLLDRGADINHKDNVSYCDACMTVLWYCQLTWYLISINITECWLACMYVWLTGIQCFLSVYDSDSDSFSSSPSMSCHIISCRVIFCATSE